MRILLTNDDGIGAPGLKHLFEALPVAEVVIVAPSHERSGAGASISMFKPLHLKEVNWEGAKAYSLSGTPADCVKLAVEILERPDLILSGINPGSNAGRNLFYSGTVGGVLEGSLHGIPGAAISCIGASQPNFTAARSFVPQVIDFLLSGQLPKGTLLNVNVPPGAVNGMRMARQGLGFYRAVPDRRTHPQGHDYFWLGGEKVSFEEHPESDIQLLDQGYATAVPVRLSELTCPDVYEKSRSTFDQLFSRKTKASS